MIYLQSHGDSVLFAVEKFVSDFFEFDFVHVSASILSSNASSCHAPHGTFTTTSGKTCCPSCHATSVVIRSCFLVIKESIFFSVRYLKFLRPILRVNVKCQFKLNRGYYFNNKSIYQLGPKKVHFRMY